MATRSTAQVKQDRASERKGLEHAATTLRTESGKFAIKVGVAAAAGSLLGGPVLDATSPRTAFVIVGCGGLAGAALTAVLLRKARRRPDTGPAAA